MLTDKQENIHETAVQSELAYEDAIAELESIVQKLERGEVKLEESAKLYERGVKLSQYCSGILKEMHGKITELSISSDGEVQERVLGQD